MNKRPARTKTEIDLLPPFGQPEVVTVGNGAIAVAILATVLVAGIADSVNK